MKKTHRLFKLKASERKDRPAAADICSLLSSFNTTPAAQLIPLYCSDTRYEDKLNDKEGQHQALQTAWEDHSYQMSTLPIILGVSGSHFPSTTDAFKQLGIGHDAINTLMLKLHEHSITCLHNIVTSRRVLERTESGQEIAPLKAKFTPFSAMLTPDSLGVCMASGCF